MESARYPRLPSLSASLALVVALQACSGGSSDTTKPTPPAAAVTSPGKVLLGPVSAATVQIFALDSQDTPLCETSTSSGTDLESVGHFDIPTGCISPGNDYLLIASGGQDIDANDDGVLDDTPTPVNGQVRALLSSEELNEDGWKINALTESVYQNVKFHLQDADRETIATLKKSAAARLLSTSVDNNGEINYSDILQWDPREDTEKLTDKEQLNTVLRTIHDGTNKPQLPDTSTIEGFDLLNIDAHISTAHLHNNLALLGTGTNLLLVDVTPDKNMRLGAVIADLQVTDITSKGNHAYVAVGEKGLKIIDLSDAENPEIVGAINDPTHKLAWHGQSLLASSSKGERTEILTLNISAADKPQIVSRQTLQKPAQSTSLIAVHNNYLYAVSSSASLTTSAMGIYDLSQTGDTLSASSSVAFDLQTKTPPSQIAFDDNTVFLKSYEHLGPQRIYRYDISNPAQAKELSELALSADARAMQLTNDALYQLDKRQLSILQMPGLGELSKKTLPVDYAHFNYQDGYAYLYGNTLGRLKLPDVSRANTTTGQITIAAIADADVSLYRHGASEAVCSSKSSTGTPAEAGHITFDLSCISEQGYYLLSVAGGQNIDADQNGIADASATAFNGNLHALLSADELRAGGWTINAATELAYRSLAPALDDLDDNNLAANLKRLANALLSTNISSKPGIDNDDLLQFNAVDHAANFIPGNALLNAWRQGVLDNSDTSAQIESLAFAPMFTLPLNSNFFGTSLSGNNALLAVLNNEALSLYAPADSVGLHKLGQLTLENASKQLIHNNYLYVAYSNGTLEVYDVTLPASPQLAATLSDIVYTSASESPAEMRVYQDNLLIVSKQAAGSDDNVLHIIDISSPESPSLRSTTDLQNDLAVMDMEIHNQHLYLVSMYAGLNYSDLKDHLDIYSLETLDSPLNKISAIHHQQNQTQFGDSLGISIGFHNNLAYLFASSFIDARQSHFRVYDVSSPATPIHLDTLFSEQASAAGLVYANALYSMSAEQLLSYALPTLQQARVVNIPRENANAYNLEVIGEHIYAVAGSLYQLPLPVLPQVDALQGEIALGRIAAATVAVHALDDRNGAALCSASSSDESALQASGNIRLPVDCVSNGGLFIVSSNGGVDIDSDNDGVRDSNPSPVAGTMHAIVSADELLQPGWRINPLSEAAYQLVVDQLDSTDAQTLLDRLNTAATVLLKTDLNADGEINRKDLLHWNPSAHSVANTHYAAANFAALLNSIRNDSDTQLVASSLSAQVKAAISVDNRALKQLSASNTLVVVGDESAQTQIFEVTPSALNYAASITDNAHELLLDGTTLYLINDDALKVFDLSTPASPQLLGSYAGVYNKKPGINESFIWLQGDTLFSVSSIQSNGANIALLALDVADPANITLSAQTALAPGELAWVETRNTGKLYLVTTEPGLNAASGNATLSTWDLSAPNAPVEIGQGVEISGGPFSSMALNNNDELLISTGSTLLPEQGCLRIDVSNNSIALPANECVLPGRGYLQDANSAVTAALSVEDPSQDTRVLILDDIDSLNIADRQQVQLPALDYKTLVLVGDKAYALGKTIIEVTLP